MRYLKYFAPFILIIFLFQSCEKEDKSVIDPFLTFPRITAAFVNPTSVSSASINAIVSAVVVSQDGISSVTGKIFNPINAEVLTVQLKDDGVAPDTTAGDGRFTANITYSPSCVIVGSYKIELVAVGSGGTSSNVVNVTLNVFQSGNLPPAISNLIIPDSLQRPTGSNLNTAFLQIKAIDPNGQCDIKDVYFYSYRPDGTPTNNGNSFSMFDDGDIALHCDTTAGDTKYSLCVVINSTAQLGYFKFRFNAKDRSLDTTNYILDSINVYP